jgi:hypothetical protein
MIKWTFPEVAPETKSNVVPFRKQFYTALVDLINIYAPHTFMSEVMGGLYKAVRVLAEEQKRQELLEKDDR